MKGLSPVGRRRLLIPKPEEWPYVLPDAADQPRVTVDANNLTTLIAPDTLRADPTAFIDLRAGQGSFVNVQIPSTLTAPMTLFNINSGGTTALGAGGGVRALILGGSWTIAATPNGFPFLVFVFSPTVTFTAPQSRLQSWPAFRTAPALNVSSGVAIPLLGGNIYGAEVVPNFADIAGGGSAGGPNVHGIRLLPNVGVGWTLPLLTGVKAFKPTGTGIITDTAIVDIDDLITGATVTYTAVPKSLRSLAPTIGMQHAGPIKVGSVGAPNTPSGVDIDGDLSTRSADLALVNGVNNDIAIGNRSFIRITGPTAAFSISSIASPQNGKRLVIVNTTAFAMTITNAALVGTAANRIVTSTLADLVGTATHPSTVELVYDATTARWRDINFRP